MEENRKLTQLLKNLADNIKQRQRYERIIQQLKQQIFLEVCPPENRSTECLPQLCAKGLAGTCAYRKLIADAKTQPGLAETYIKSTSERFDLLIGTARNLFVNKIKDYGPSWMLLRWESLVDQIWIKASRIRTLQELGGEKLIPEGVESEFVGIINYSVMALIKLWYGAQVPYAADMLQGRIVTVDHDLMASLYDQVIERIRDLLLKKNHDYGEAWRDMDIVSITDQIFVKLYRIKTILENSRQLEVSEDIDAQFSDTINYAVFALIKLSQV